MREIIEGGAPKFNLSMAGSVKTCDYCKSCPALLYCKVDSAFTCIACDAKAHSYGGENLAHERVWMCEVCERAPAAFTCKADAASLCVACDGDIHSANPLAGRHERVPVVPFYDTAESLVMMMKPTVAMDYCHPMMMPLRSDSLMNPSNIITQHANSNKLPMDNNHHDSLKSLEFLFSDADQILDFDGYHQQQPPFSDSVVPVQTHVKPPIIPDHQLKTGARTTHDVDDHYHLSFEIDFTRSTVNSFNNTTPSLSHSVSSSSMDVGVVPDGNSSLSDISYSLEQSMNCSGGNQGQNMDREARVLRYREKRKNRKFEKTIRYASRKAYAEARPRIKGRFAKRTDSACDLDRIFAIADFRYGVVPSF